MASSPPRKFEVTYKLQYATSVFAFHALRNSEGASRAAFHYSETLNAHGSDSLTTGSSYIRDQNSRNMHHCICTRCIYLLQAIGSLASINRPCHASVHEQCMQCERVCCYLPQGILVTFRHTAYLSVVIPFSCVQRLHTCRIHSSAFPSMIYYVAIIN